MKVLHNLHVQSVDSVFLQVTSLLYFHGFSMMSPLFKAILMFVAQNILCEDCLILGSSQKIRSRYFSSF